MRVSTNTGQPGATLGKPASVDAIAARILEDGENSWKGWLFELVDDFRRQPSGALIAVPPPASLPARLGCLLASTVEALCAESGLPPPAWCAGVGALSRPWFVAETENLKASALVEAPVFFRKRNLFVLGNFLSRA